MGDCAGCYLTDTCFECPGGYFVDPNLSTCDGPIPEIEFSFFPTQNFNSALNQEYRAVIDINLSLGSSPVSQTDYNTLIADITTLFTIDGLSPTDYYVVPGELPTILILIKSHPDGGLSHDLNIVPNASFFPAGDQKINIVMSEEVTADDLKFAASSSSITKFNEYSGQSSEAVALLATILSVDQSGILIKFS